MLPTYDPFPFGTIDTTHNPQPTETIALETVAPAALPLLPFALPSTD